MKERWVEKVTYSDGDNRHVVSQVVIGVWFHEDATLRTMIVEV